jgi:hypothetical protein
MILQQIQAFNATRAEHTRFNRTTIQPSHPILLILVIGVSKVFPSFRDLPFFYTFNATRIEYTQKDSIIIRLIYSYADYIYKIRLNIPSRHTDLLHIFFNFAQ